MANTKVVEKENTLPLVVFLKTIGLGLTEIHQDYSYEHDRRELASFSSERVVVSFRWGPSTPNVTYIRRGRMLSTSGRRILKDTGWETDTRVTIPRGELLSKLKAMGSR